MNRQQMTRRILLGAVAVTLALPGLGAAAEGGHDYGSREDFEDLCATAGGDFTDTGDGNLWCQFPEDNSQDVCDVNGNDCYTIPYTPPPPPPGPALGGDPATQGDDPPSGPAVEDPPPPGVTAPDDEQPQDQSPSKHGKKGKHGKRGKR